MRIQIVIGVLSLCTLATSFWFPTLVEYTEKWGYIQVRPDANLFWWLYYRPFETRPLILWLQGGPGASGTGLGNFQEIGPLDDRLQPRNSTWLNEADLLFIDNPVGTGFSYVTNQNAYTKNIDEITADLLEFFIQWLTRYPEFQVHDFYIFSESYGGKMNAAFAKVLIQAIRNGKLSMRFRGIALGDSWISPMDYVNSWGPYLHAFSFVDDQQLELLNNKANECQNLVSKQQWSKASNCWGESEDLVVETTNGVSFYNVMQFDSTDNSAIMLQEKRISDPYRYKRLKQKSRALQLDSQSDPLADLMNGVIRKTLGIIPNNVTWQESSDAVFTNQYGDFMRPVVDIVDELLEQAAINVTVYSGQLDLICDVLGTEVWMNRLKWKGMTEFNSSTRKNFFKADHYQAGFYKAYKNLRFFWILDAGHMVPTDNPQGALEMVRMVLGKK